MCVVLWKYTKEGTARSEIPRYGDFSGAFNIPDLACNLLMRS